MKKIITPILLLTSLSAMAQEIPAPSFGFKHIVLEKNEVMQTVAKATAAMVKKQLLMPDNKYDDVVELAYRSEKMKPSAVDQEFNKIFAEGTSFSPNYKTLADSNFCRSEKWVNEVILSECSGTLVSDRYLVTAGHCVTKREEMCANYSWVFDYKLDSEGQLPKSYTKDQVYSCKKIVKRINSDVKVYGSHIRGDFAVIELDRPVVGRSPVKVSQNKSVKVGTKIVNISYPLGTPAKISSVGTVSSFMNTRGIFWFNAPAFSGSSGGGIFNAETGEMVGVVAQTALNTKIKEYWNPCTEMIDLQTKADRSEKRKAHTTSGTQMRKIIRTLKKLKAI